MWTTYLFLFFVKPLCIYIVIFCPNANLDIKGKFGHLGNWISIHSLFSLLCHLRNCWESFAAFSGSHDSNDLKFLSRTLSCNMTMNCIQFTWLHNQYVFRMSSSGIQSNTRDENATKSLLFTMPPPLSCC